MDRGGAVRAPRASTGEDCDGGFTLIELMVVVLIIAILLAIAIPTFLGSRNTANARAAQSNLRNALTAELTFFANNNQSFSAVTADLTTIEPNLGWTTTAPTTKGGNTVAAAVYTSAGAQDVATKPDTGDSAVVVQAYGIDGNCYGILRVDGTTSGIAVGTYYNTPTRRPPAAAPSRR